MDSAVRCAFCVITFVLATALLARYSELSALQAYPVHLVHTVQQASRSMLAKRERSIETTNPMMALMYADAAVAEVSLLRELIGDDGLRTMTGIDAHEFLSLCNEQHAKSTQTLLDQLPTSGQNAAEAAKIYNRALNDALSLHDARDALPSVDVSF